MYFGASTIFSEVFHPTMPRAVAINSCLKLIFRVMETGQLARKTPVAVLFPNTEFATRSYQRLERELRENLIDSELSEKFNLSRKYIRHFSDVANSKGLEFDVVILVGVELQIINKLTISIVRNSCNFLQKSVVFNFRVAALLEVINA